MLSARREWTTFGFSLLTALWVIRSPTSIQNKSPRSTGRRMAGSSRYFAATRNQTWCSCENRSRKTDEHFSRVSKRHPDSEAGRGGVRKAAIAAGDVHCRAGILNYRYQAITLTTGPTTLTSQKSASRTWCLKVLISAHDPTWSPRSRCLGSWPTTGQIGESTTIRTSDCRPSEEEPAPARC